MARYKLTYFTFKGRGELARYLFAYAGVAHDDVRIDLAKWPQEKKSKSRYLYSVFCHHKDFKCCNRYYIGFFIRAATWRAKSDIRLALRGLQRPAGLNRKFLPECIADCQTGTSHIEELV
ncbi:Hematopoietic prostaglandin D synthase [Holothuria leucospilota]|uniref:Hematopoietic prostaglandin D synthase n=1 Tax=Holothuria leucospilota TaxID=206669 RepID=A0A9Q0YQ74_HOLLE|nr:Hematopoietic prostaglandin D synthase [Holothuria leucospilota]